MTVKSAFGSASRLRRGFGLGLRLGRRLGLCLQGCLGRTRDPRFHELLRKIGFTEAQIDGADALAGKRG
jgi:hypothetical protein